MNDRPRSRSGCKRDLGVLVSSDLRPRAEPVQARNRTNKVLDFISRRVSNGSAGHS